MTAKVYARWFMDIPPFEFELRRTGNGLQWRAVELTQDVLVVSPQTGRAIVENSRKSLAAYLNYAYGNYNPKEN